MTTSIHNLLEEAIDLLIESENGNSKAPGESLERLFAIREIVFGIDRNGKRS
jgi:hypothetical protein